MLFQFEDVTKTYGTVTALDNLSVSVPIGAIGLLGPNGSGKTTMIRTLLGLIPVDRGTGEVLGMDFRSRQLDIRRLVGFAPEDECLFPHVVGVEFVAYAGELVGMSRQDAMQRAHEVLDYVGLGEARYRKVESYSTGMKQRLKLASAIVHDPKLLILDEPTNGMDPAGRRGDARTGPRPGAQQGHEPAVFQPSAARRRSGVRLRRRAGRRQAARRRQDPRAQAGARPMFRSAAQGGRRRFRRAAWQPLAARPTVATTSSACGFQPSRSPQLLWELAAAEHAANSLPAAAAQHAGRSLPESRQPNGQEQP